MKRRHVKGLQVISMLAFGLMLHGCVDMTPVAGGVLTTNAAQRFTDEAIARDWVAMDELRERIAAARPRASLAYAIVRAEAELDLAVEEYEENDATGFVEALLNDARRLVVTQEQASAGGDLAVPDMPGMRRVRLDLWQRAEEVKREPGLLRCAGEPLARLEAGLLELAHEQYEVDRGLNDADHVAPYARLVDQLARALEDAVADCTPPAPVAEAAPLPPPRALYSLAASALFHFDRYAESDMLPEGRTLLDRFGQDLADKPELWQRLVIVGHADRLSRHAYNLPLSQRRADTVKAYLVKRFSLDASRIETRGMAALKPVVFCTGPVNEALKVCLQPNRRVEIEVR